MCSRIMRTLEVFVTHVRLTSDPTIAEIQGLTCQPTSNLRPVDGNPHIEVALLRTFALPKDDQAM
jgi:hypothetical protein